MSRRPIPRVIVRISRSGAPAVLLPPRRTPKVLPAPTPASTPRRSVISSGIPLELAPPPRAILSSAAAPPISEPPPAGPPSPESVVSFPMIIPASPPEPQRPAPAPTSRTVSASVASASAPILVMRFRWRRGRGRRRGEGAPEDELHELLLRRRVPVRRRPRLPERGPRCGLGGVERLAVEHVQSAPTPALSPRVSESVDRGRRGRARGRSRGQGRRGWERRGRRGRRGGERRHRRRRGLRLRYCIRRLRGRGLVRAVRRREPLAREVVFGRDGSPIRHRDGRRRRARREWRLIPPLAEARV